MTRILSLLAVALVAAALLLLPEVQGERLAALEAHELLQLPAGSEPGAPALAELALADLPRAPGGARVLALGEVRVARLAPAEPAAADAAEAQRVDELARRSIVRGLREALGEAPRDVAGGGLEIAGELAPAQASERMDFLLEWRPDHQRLTWAPAGAAPIAVERPWSPPQRSSLWPPLVAILLAISLRRPLLALFVGVLSAAWLRRSAEGLGPLEALGAASLWVPERLAEPGGADSAWARFARHLPDWIARDLWAQLSDLDRALIMAFVILMLAMVGIITRAGGIRGLMESIARVARGPRSTQLAGFLMGLVIFFDDYANTILVGVTMRPLTDRFRIAREKLAYIVDSTAAPVAGLSVFSTWIAFEVSTFSAQLPAAGLLPADGYSVFLQSLPFRFYSILSLALVALVALSNRDFGPMLRAEHRARVHGLVLREGAKPMVSSEATDLEPVAGIAPHAATAVYPILTFLAVTLFDIARSGGALDVDWPAAAREARLASQLVEVIGAGSGTLPLVAGSTAGLWVAMAIAHAKGMRPFGEILRAAWTSLRSLSLAIAILYLAWMIGDACRDLSTATYLTGLLGDRVSPFLLPGLLFILASIVSFSTGSSWSTMSILLPLVVGLAFTLGESIPALGGHFLMILSIGAVLEGSIFGDHCSPISDTTVLSSTSSASDHFDHVRTQAPYAFVTMLVALCAGYLPCAFWKAWSPWHALASGFAVLVAVLFVFGRQPETYSPRV